MPDREAERRYAARFRDVYPDFPRGDLLDFEGPDFLVRSNVPILGVEVTRMFKDPAPGSPPKQLLESRSRTFVAEAERAFRALDSRPLTVSVHLNHNWHPKKVERRAAAQFLAELLHALDLHVGGAARIAFPDERLRPHRRAFHAILVHWFEVSTDGFWAVPDADFIGAVTPEMVQRVLDRKNKLVDGYRLHAPLLWLLVVVDGAVLSSAMEVGPEVAAHRYNLGFDRAFLFDSFIGAFWRLDAPQCNVAA